jgi:HlyD family secretion protein
LWLGSLAAAVLLALVFIFRGAIFGIGVDAYPAVRSDVIQSIVASGRIATPQRVSVAAVLTGRVSRIPVEEGQEVARGDILIVVDDEDERAAVNQGRAAVAQADAKVRQLRELSLPSAEQGRLQAEANYTQARRSFERSAELKAKGFLSQAALDDAQRNLNVAESQLHAAQLQVESNGPAGSDHQMAQMALAQARAVLALAQAKLDQTVIRAPVSGTLIARTVEAGNVVQPGKELMLLAPTGDVQVVVQIDEKNLAQLKRGQHALVSADAFPKDRFTAELVYINPGIDALRGAVEVKLRVSQPPAYLRQDLTVSVDIEVGRSSDTVAIPADAVRDMASGSAWVLVLDAGRAVRRPIALGLKGTRSVEVLEGLMAGERVIVGNEHIREGQRVRPLRTITERAS